MQDDAITSGGGLASRLNIDFKYNINPSNTGTFSFPIKIIDIYKIGNICIGCIYYQYSFSSDSGYINKSTLSYMYLSGLPESIAGTGYTYVYIIDTNYRSIETVNLEQLTSASSTYFSNWSPPSYVKEIIFLYTIG